MNGSIIELSKFSIPREVNQELEEIVERLWLSQYDCPTDQESTFTQPVSKCNVNTD